MTKPRPITAPSLLMTITVALVAWISIPRLACGETETTRAVRTLQPSIPRAVAAWYADQIDDAGEETGLEPLLLVALGFRESSYLPEVVLGLRLGRLGETGILQTHGAALSMAPPRCHQSNPRCGIRTGARWLAHVRERCPGSRWRWVAGYAWRTCPSERSARRDKGARRARAIYCRIRRDCKQAWPE